MLAAEFGTGQVFWSMLWFTMFVVWVWLLFAVFADVFRSPDLSGWGKALWSIFVIVMPYLGVFVYLIARGGKMAEHRIQEAQAREAMFREYVREAAASPPADNGSHLDNLAALRAGGVIDDVDYERMRARIG